MGGAQAEAVALFPDGREVEIPFAPKQQVAARILDLAETLIAEPDAGGAPA
jgi:hypothetical protein